MKLGPITIGGRRDIQGGAGYQHCTANIIINPEDGDSVDYCMTIATQVLSDAFDAAEAGVEKRSVRAPAPTPQPRPAPAPAPAPKATPSQPLQAFPTTGVGQLAKEIVAKVEPQAGKAPARSSKAQPAPSAPLSPQLSADADGLKRRVDAWRKFLTEYELPEADFLRVCEVSKPEELPQLKTFGITSKQLKAFVEDVAKILKNADNVPM